MNYGVHLTLRIADIERRQALQSGPAIAAFLSDLVGQIGMRILAGPLTAEETGPPDKRGWSSVVILYESHAAIHTYPELGEVFLDLFSCKPYEVSDVKEMFQRCFGSYTIKEQEIFDRGIHWGEDIHAEMDSWRALRV